ncbi:MAG TPA: hypothetical protein VF816_03965 [Rhodocyclaceae bacterium]
MNRKAIVTKTAKGMREASGGMRSLGRSERRVLKEVDGKSTLDDLALRLGSMAEPIEEIVARMVADGYIRELPLAPQEAPRETRREAPREAPADADDALDLDFTRSAADSKPQPKPDAGRSAARAAEEQLERARQAAAEAAKRAAAESARREAEEKARKEAEEKARREAEEKARREAEEKARKEAQEKARREAEEEARREAEEKARKEAEEKARREAEEKARKEAEEKARKEAEEKARREAEEKARREAEEKARKEAEEKARREAEEKARREAEEKVRKEAEEKARREAEEKARREAEEKARKEAEEKARREAEEKARREAEEKARKEAQEKARREAEEKARREAEEKGRREAEAKARREAEEKLRKLVEEKDRKQAEETARREAEEETRRLKEEDARREAKKDGRRESAPARRRVRLGPMLAVVLALLIGGLALLHLMPFDGTARHIEQLATERLQQPVKIAAAHFSLFPRPHWILDGVTIGGAEQVLAPRIKLFGGTSMLMGGEPAFQAIEADAPKVSAEALGRLLLGHGPGLGWGVSRVEARAAVIEFSGFGKQSLDAGADLAPDGKWREIKVAFSGTDVSAVLVPTPGAVKFSLQSKASPLPFLTAVPGLSDVVADGVADRDGATVSRFEARAAGGALSGSARVRFGSQPEIAGDVAAKGLSLVQLLPGLFERGVLEGRASFTLPVAVPAREARLSGGFAVRDGILAGVDLGAAMRGAAHGGVTRFDRLVGEFVLADGQAHLRQARLDAGMLAARAEADMTADRSLHGRLDADLTGSTVRRHAALELSGTFAEPYAQNVRWTRR